MENEERNRIMDNILRRSQQGSYEISQGTGARYAIRECDKKARAWDELEVHYEKASNVSCFQPPYRGFCQEVVKNMAKFLTPPPKDPLEVLEEWGDRLQDDGVTSIGISKLLAEIRRLRGKK